MLQTSPADTFSQVGNFLQKITALSILLLKRRPLNASSLTPAKLFFSLFVIIFFSSFLLPILFLLFLWYYFKTLGSHLVVIIGTKIRPIDFARRTQLVCNRQTSGTKTVVFKSRQRRCPLSLCCRCYRVRLGLIRMKQRVLDVSLDKSGKVRAKINGQLFNYQRSKHKPSSTRFFCERYLLYRRYV